MQIKNESQQPLALGRTEIRIKDFHGKSRITLIGVRDRKRRLITVLQKGPFNFWSKLSK